LLSRLVDVGGRALRVRRLGGTRAGEIRLTRFLRNEAVTIEEMLMEAEQRTSLRCQGRHVLAIQDTTVLRSEGGGGDYLHAMIGLDAEDGTILGLIDAQFLSRQSGRKVARRAKSIEAKESFRWLQAADQAASVCAGAQRITVVADRESDIFEAFALRPDGVDLLIRAAQDRCLMDASPEDASPGEGNPGDASHGDANPGDDGLQDGRLLFAAIDKMAEAGRAELDLPAGPGRKRRTARLALRYARVSMARPAHGERTGLPDAVEVNVVDVREIDPPSDDAAVHWRLLTTHAVDNAADAWAVAALYRRRWAIEQVFRTLKTKGFDVEGLRIADAEPRNKLVTAALIAALQIQQLVHARDGGPGPLRPCTDVLQPDDLPLIEALCRKLQGKTERQKNPHPKGSLAYVAWVCARLGGWTGYYGKPGPIVMLEGWLEFQATKRALALFSSVHDV
jgi:hypothetical protein